MQSCKKEGQNKVWLSISARPSADKTKFPVLLHKPFFGQQIVCRLQKPLFRDSGAVSCLLKRKRRIRKSLRQFANNLIKLVLPGFSVLLLKTDITLPAITFAFFAKITQQHPAPAMRPV